MTATIVKPLRAVLRIAMLICCSITVSASAFAQSAPTITGGGLTDVNSVLQVESALFGTSLGTVSYSPAGSGKGSIAFASNDATQFGLASTIPVDFGIVSGPFPPYPLATVDGPPIQIPYLIIPVTIPFVNGPAASVTLNDDDLCRIFSGLATTWNQITDPDTVDHYTSAAPINVIYHTENSSMTRYLTRHLAAVCTVLNSAITFTEQENFSSEFSTIPSNFIGESNSGAVASELVSLRQLGTSAISYLSPPYTNTTLAPQSSAAFTNNLSVAVLFNSNSHQDAQPTIAQAAVAASAMLPPTNTIAHDATEWVINVPNPSSGYPIIGVPNIFLSTCYASHSVASAIVNFLFDHYTNSTIISALHGYGFGTLSQSYVTTIDADFLTNSSRLNLNIENATVCASFAGR